MLEDNFYPQAYFATQYERNLQTSEAQISKTIDLNDIKFGRAVKKSLSIIFQNFGLVAHNICMTLFL